MEALVKIVLGFCLLAMSLSYLYRPVWVLKVNQLVREILFNDANLLHYRRRLGVPLFAAALLFLYSGMVNLKVRSGNSRAAAYSDMNEAYRAFYARQYAQADKLCSEILKTNPREAHALFLLRQSRKATAPSADVLPSTPTVRAVRHRR